MEFRPRGRRVATVIVPRPPKSRSFLRHEIALELQRRMRDVIHVVQASFNFPADRLRAAHRNILHVDVRFKVNVRRRSSSIDGRCEYSPRPE